MFLLKLWSKFQNLNKHLLAVLRISKNGDWIFMCKGNSATKWLHNFLPIKLQISIQMYLKPYQTSANENQLTAKSRHLFWQTYFCVSLTKFIIRLYSISKILQILEYWSFKYNHTIDCNRHCTGNGFIL